VTAVELAQALWLLVAALGLALSVSYAGLPVLGQGAFVAVGGVGTALLGPGGRGLPLGVAVAVSVATAAAVGHLVARGASRLEGAYLALATWALAWLVHRVLEAFPTVFGGEQGLVRPAPARLVSPALGLELVLTPAAHVVLAGLTCLTLILVVRRIDAGPAGLDLAALREGPALAASLGVPVAARRRAVLTVTAALGALSGAGTTVLLGLVAPADVSPLLSLQLFVAVLIGGTARWWGPVLGVALLSALPPVADALAAGAGLAPERARGALTAALLVVVVAARGPVARHLARPRPELPRAPGEAEQDVPPPDPREWRPVLLRATGVRVAYGAVQALDDARITLRGGEVHALVGPNGSGKSTLLKVLAGDLRPEAGQVAIGGALQGGGTEERVLAGVARTPQRTVVLPRSTPERQVAVGARGGARSPDAVVRHLLGTPSSRAAGATRSRVVAAALRSTGLSGVAGRDPRALTVGEQRLLQVARVVATGAQVLLLDEPAAGMTAAERSRLAQVLQRLAGNGSAVLLVEHDMRLVGEVADRVTVLDRGRVLAVGRPEQVRADPAVRAAYLGGRAR
jgi:ABC-type branched-subunit amino acid transport system ATPase component/ABC-type branched-subunit amino acid transport system permease subunit